MAGSPAIRASGPPTIWATGPNDLTSKRLSRPAIAGQGDRALPSVRTGELFHGYKQALDYRRGPISRHMGACVQPLLMIAMPISPSAWMPASSRCTIRHPAGVSRN